MGTRRLGSRPSFAKASLWQIPQASTATTDLAGPRLGDVALDQLELGAGLGDLKGLHRLGHLGDSSFGGGSADGALPTHRQCPREGVSNLVAMNQRNFRYVAIIEATTFLALLVASYIKRANDAPIGVEILGPIHGILFLAYLYMAVSLRTEMRWSARTTALILIGAVVPFGGYAVDRWLREDRGESPSGNELA